MFIQLKHSKDTVLQISKFGILVLYYYFENNLAFLGKGVDNFNFTSEHDIMLAVGKYLLLNYTAWDHIRPR